MYQTTRNETHRDNYKNMKVELCLSMAFALFHTFFEGLILYLESQALKVSILQYTVTCMNGRFNWVPFLKKIKPDGKTKDINYQDITINLVLAKVNKHKNSSIT